MLGDRTPSSSKSGGGRALRCVLSLPDHPDYSLLGFRVLLFLHFLLEQVKLRVLLFVLLLLSPIQPLSHIRKGQRPHALLA